MYPLEAPALQLCISPLPAAGLMLAGTNAPPTVGIIWVEGDIILELCCLHCMVGGDCCGGQNSGSGGSGLSAFIPLTFSREGGAPRDKAISRHCSSVGHWGTVGPVGHWGTVGHYRPWGTVGHCSCLGHCRPCGALGHCGVHPRAL